MTKLVSAYIRQSQTYGSSGLSPEQQRDQIQKYCRDHDLQIEGEYVDLDKSGGSMKRPEFTRMMKTIEAGNSSGVVVAKIDRFGRSLVGALQELERLKGWGATFASVQDRFDTDTATGEMMMNIMLSLAQFELRRIRDNWDDVDGRAIKNGVHFTNSIPFGFTRGDDRRLQLDPVTAPIAREMFSRRAERQSRNQIARWLNEVTPRENGKQWTARNVATMIQSEAYKGVAFHGKHRNENAHPTIVTIAEWDAANRVKGGAGAVTSDSSLLSGLIRCAGCRYAMRRNNISYRHADGTKDRRVTYVCQRHFTGGSCPEPAQVMAHHIEPLVAQKFLAWYGRVERTEGDDGPDAVGEAERALQDAEQRLERFLGDDDLRETISRDRYRAEAQRRQQAVDQAEAALEAARNDAHDDDIRTFMLANEWEDFDTEGQAGILRTVIDAVYVKKGHSGRDPIEDRVLIRWAGENRYELPKRGTTNYQVRPVPWPPAGMLTLANVPEWAIRNGHPALPEDVRRGVQDEAREQGADWYLGTSS